MTFFRYFLPSLSPITLKATNNHSFIQTLVLFYKFSRRKFIHMNFFNIVTNSSKWNELLYMSQL